MKPRSDAQVAEWLASALVDVEAATVLHAHDPSMSVPIGFHCQQAVEKRLKAVLVALDQAVPKIHDLLALLEALREALPLAEGLRKEAAWLTTFAVVGRYPSYLLAEHDPKVSARRCLDAAHSLSEEVEALFERAESIETPG